MDRGTYAAASGGLVQMRKLEVVNNNLANVNTVGFKREYIVGQNQTFEQTLASTLSLKDPYARGDHQRTPGVVDVQTATDFSPGPIKNTGNVLDVALRDPRDFFVVETPDGERYTRAGNFTLNEEAELVTVDGMRVMGDGGPINANGVNLSISPDGTVRAGGNVVGRLRVVRFEDPSGLQRVGGSRFTLPAGAPGPADTEPQVLPQALEMANVSAITSVLELIMTNRAFDMYTRSSRSIDEMNQQAIQQVGRRR